MLIVFFALLALGTRIIECLHENGSKVASTLTASCPPLSKRSIISRKLVLAGLFRKTVLYLAVMFCAGFNARCNLFVQNVGGSLHDTSARIREIGQGTLPPSSFPWSWRALLSPSELFASQSRSIPIVSQPDSCPTDHSPRVTDERLIALFHWNIPSALNQFSERISLCHHAHRQRAIRRFVASFLRAERRPYG
jgi:hypothetical protein